jgi:hypothetical protein
MPAAMVFLLGVHRFMLSTDGVIMVSSSAFEGESIAAGRQWLEGNGKDLYMVGPLENAPPSATLRSEPGKKSQPGSPEDAEVLAFLDRMHSTSGARSTLFVSHAGPAGEPKRLNIFLSDCIRKHTLSEESGKAACIDCRTARQERAVFVVPCIPVRRRAA